VKRCQTGNLRPIPFVSQAERWKPPEGVLSRHEDPMNLTSSWFLTGLAVAAVAAVAASCFLWNRLVGNAPATWLARAGLLVTVQLTGVALLAGLVNAQNDFYPTLGSLLGSSPSAAAVEQGAPSSGWVSVTTANAALVAMHHPVRTAAGSLWLDPQSKSFHSGTTLDGTLNGSISHLTANDVKVWLPPQYATRAYAGRVFPVLMVLTGYPGNPQTWWSLANIPKVAGAAIADHSMPPFVVVALNPDIAPPRDTECTDIPGGPAVQTFLHSDVPIDLQHLLAVYAAGSHWASMGDSTGGYCSALLALRYPSEFPTAVSLGGYFTPITDFTTGNLDHGSAVHKDLRNPMWLLAHHSPVSVSLLLCGATGDHHTVAALQAFEAAARPPTSVSTLVVQGGGHNWATWNTQIPTALRWIGKIWGGAGRSTVQAGGTLG
jgi:S-formylglutathione hydrolase FrmB